MVMFKSPPPLYRMITAYSDAAKTKVAATTIVTACALSPDFDVDRPSAEDHKILDDRVRNILVRECGLSSLEAHRVIWDMTIEN